MASYTTADIRNIALTGTSSAGKTTLTEVLLGEAGVIGRVGKIEEGNTVTDYSDLEHEFECSLDTALVHFEHAGVQINLIDTPGRPDFIGKAISSVPAVETVAIMIDPSKSVETVTRRMMKVCEQRNLPRLLIINKIDQVDDLDSVLEAIRETYGMACQPINLPTGGGTGVIDCLTNDSGESDLGDLADFHTNLVEQVVESDEALMEKYLEQGEVSMDDLRTGFERAMREASLIPVVFVSARENVGVKELLDVFATLCPSPLQGNPRSFEYTGADDERTEILAAVDASKPVIAHVFKISSDPYVGRLAYFKVHQGEIGASVSPYVDDQRKPIRTSHVFKAQGKESKEASKIVAGDIGVLAKIDELKFNSVMHDGSIGTDLHLRPLELPEPMFGQAIEVASKGAEGKLGDALAKMLAEDPMLALDRVQATRETVLRGIGEQHMRVKLRMLKDQYSVEVDTRMPKVAYKETIHGKADGHHRHKKQTGGAGQFGEVYLRVAPLTGEEEGIDRGLIFSDDTFGGSIPKQFLPAVEKGVRQCMIDGAVAGYPMTNISVSVYDGKYHAVDSKEVAFVTAGKRAFIDAIQQASPVLLEPFVKMEITVPAEQIGDIASDISGRRGRIQGTDMLPGNIACVQAEAPLAEVMTYSSQLKSMTAGAGSYTMEYSHDEQTPPNVQADVVASYKPDQSDD